MGPHSSTDFMVLFMGKQLSQIKGHPITVAHPNKMAFSTNLFKKYCKKKKKHFRLSITHRTHGEVELHPKIYNLSNAKSIKPKCSILVNRGIAFFFSKYILYHLTCALLNTIYCCCSIFKVVSRNPDL